MHVVQLEIFAAIVDNGSLTEAAEAIGLTQSAISASLTKLEAELGVKLLERGRHGIQLTHIGEAVLARARVILQQVDEIRQQTMIERDLVVGKVRFGCVPQIPDRLLTGLLQDFRGRYPGIDVVLFQGSSTEIRSWLEGGVIDVGTVPMAEGMSAVMPLVKSEIHVLLAASHKLARHERIDVQEVLQEPLIGSKGDLEVVYRLFQPVSATPIDIRHQITEFSTVYAMVAEGWGVALLPAILIDSSLKNVTDRPLNPPFMMEAYLAATQSSPAVEAFLTGASAWAQSHGFWTDLA